jgi:hypothetical protein
MQWSLKLGRRGRPLSTRLFGSALLVLTTLPTVAHAQDAPCPLVEASVVAQAVGAPVQGGIMLDPISNKPFDTGPNVVVCLFDSETDTIGVSRELNAFGPGGVSGPAAFALSKMRLPAEAVAEVDALRQAGVSDIQLPTFQMSEARGLGDAAVWVYQSEPTLLFNSGGFFVQRGADALVVTVTADDEPTARAQATMLTQSLLAAL